MVARKLGIDKENSGVLDQLDDGRGESLEESGEAVEEVVQLEKQQVTVSYRAMHWQTGEKMVDWVKGLTFDVLETKEVSQTAYLLEEDGVVLDWLLERDVVGM